MYFKFMTFWPSLAVACVAVALRVFDYMLDVVSVATGVAWTALAGEPVAAAPQISQFRTFQRRLGESQRKRRYRQAAFRAFGSPALA